MHEEVIVSPVRVIPTDIQSTVAHIVSVSADIVADLVAAQLPVQCVPHEGAITTAIQPTVMNSKPILNATIEETLVNIALVSHDASPNQHINPRLQQDLDLWQRIKDYDKRAAEEAPLHSRFDEDAKTKPEKATS